MLSTHSSRCHFLFTLFSLFLILFVLFIVSVNIILIIVDCYYLQLLSDCSWLFDSLR